MELAYNRLVVGYHGTDEKIARYALKGHSLEPSENDYDWLGQGIYFWEQGPDRAYDFACEMRDKGLNNIKTPAVIGAYINLGDCLDFLDTENTKLLRIAYEIFKKDFRDIRNEVKRRDGTTLFHRLDCAVINTLVDAFKYENRKIDTVRGCFLEGKAAYPSAQIREKSHVQIAVRNPNCVVGYFRPLKHLKQNG